MESNKKKIISNTSWEIAQRIYSMVLSLLIGSITARYLGPSNYGYIGYGASLVSLFVSLSNLGMTGTIIKDLVSKKYDNGTIIGSSLIMRLTSSLLCMICVAVLVIVVEPENKLLQTITIVQSFTLLFNIYEIFECWFRANLKFKYISIASMIAYTVVGVWRIILLVNGVDVIFFSASSCVQALAAGIVILIIFGRTNKFKLNTDFSYIKELFKRSYHFILSGLAITLYTHVDKIMIGKLLQESDVGYYTAATTIATLWEFVPLAIIKTSSPVIFKYKEGNHNQYINSLEQLFGIISVLGILVSVFFTIFGRVFIYILYGKEYMSAHIPLIILIWSTTFAMIGSARGSTWIIAENYHKYSKYYVFISSAVNIVLNAILIPTLGISGAAIATLISQITTAIIAPALFKKTRSFCVIYFHSILYIPKTIKHFFK